MRIKLTPTLRIAAFVLATLGATGALVAAGLNDAASSDTARIGCGLGCVANSAQ